MFFSFNFKTELRPSCDASDPEALYGFLEPVSCQSHRNMIFKMIICRISIKKKKKHI